MTRISLTKRRRWGEENHLKMSRKFRVEFTMKESLPNGLRDMDGNDPAHCKRARAL